MRFFHAHVYYDLGQADKMSAFHARAQASGLKVWKLFDKRVGPHDKPMLEMHFTDANQSEAWDWLRANHGEFSVLIHEDTGDDAYDHEQAKWLGTPLQIHTEFFTQVKNDPSQAIHQKPKSE